MQYQPSNLNQIIFNKQQIYWRTFMLKCGFNKVAKATLLKSHFGMGVLLWICCIFSKYLFLKTPLDGCFWKILSPFNPRHGGGRCVLGIGKYCYTLPKGTTLQTHRMYSTLKRCEDVFTWTKCGVFVGYCLIQWNTTNENYFICKHLYTDIRT